MDPIAPVVAVRAPQTVAALIEARQEDLHFLKELIEAGEVTPVIDRTYSLSGIAD